MRVWPGRADCPRVYDGPSCGRLARAEEPLVQFGRVSDRDVGICFVCQPGAAAAVFADADGISGLQLGAGAVSAGNWGAAVYAFSGTFNHQDRPPAIAG